VTNIAKATANTPTAQTADTDVANYFGQEITCVDCTDCLAPNGIIDLTTIDLNADGQVDATVDLTFSNVVSETAVYNNTVGFYVVQDQAGSVVDSLTGNLLKPGDNGYINAALQQRLTNIELNRNTGSLTTQVNGGILLAPYIIANGTTDEFFAKNPTNDNYAGQLPNAYVYAAGANPDQFNHLVQSSCNAFAFEDLWYGGDNDFNDMKFQVSASKPAALSIA